MVKKVNNKKNYEVIIEKIQDMILDGSLESGDKLPSEKVLSEQFNVGRSSVREALKSLEIVGLIESRHGEGSFVKNNLNGSILKSVSIAYRLNGGRVSDILELRYILETAAAKDLTESQNKLHIEKLENIVNKMKNTENIEENEQLDIYFHNTLIKSMDNILIDIIADSISYLMEPFIKAIRNIYSGREADKEVFYYIQQHIDIVEAIKTGDVDKSIKALKTHITLTDTDLELINKLK